MERKVQTAQIREQGDFGYIYYTDITALARIILSISSRKDNGCTRFQKYCLHILMFNTKIYGIYIGTCNLKVQIEQQNVHSVVNEIK